MFGFWVMARDFRVNAVRARWAVGVSVRSSVIESGRMLTACDRTTEPIVSIESPADIAIGITRATHLRLSLTAYLA